MRALVKPIAAPVLAGIWRPWDLKMPLVVIAAVALCYLPYLSVGWGVLGFLTKGYLTEEGISAGNDLWLLSLWRLVFGEHQGDVVAYVVLAALVLTFKGLSVARSSHRTIASSLADINMLLLVALLLLSPNYPWYFLVITPFAALCGSPPNVGRFDRSALAVGTTRLGFLHSENGDQIDSVRRSFPGLGLDRLEDPHAAHRRRRDIAMSLSGEVPGTRAPFDPRRYHESVTGERTEVAQRPPVCLYLEVTNRCNLLCTTCPRTYEELEPPADMSWDLFASIVDQVPDLARAVLHGVGEPMLVANLPRMVRYLKDRSVYVLFNTNGTVLSERHGRALIDAGLDELRVSLDASNRESFKAIRGRDYFGRIIRNVRAFRELQEREGHTRPRVSVWLTGLRETVEELPAFVKVAAEIGVKEVYLQRLVFFDESAIGKARPDQTLFERLTQEEAAYLKQAEDLARSLGVTFSASGAATEPGLSLKGSGDGSPWSLCRRPWSLMYFTANGRALPCCIAPFSQHGYDNYTLGHAGQQSLREIWNGPAYRDFRAALLSDKPPKSCANCGLRWSL